MIFYFSVFVISVTPSPCQYKQKNLFLMILRKNIPIMSCLLNLLSLYATKNSHVPLCVLVVYHIKYTLHDNMSGEILTLWSYKTNKKSPGFSCLNFWDDAWWFLKFWIFGLLSSFLLLYSQHFGRYVLRPFRLFPVDLGSLHGTSNHGDRGFDSVNHNQLQVLSIPILLLGCG